MKFLHLGYYNDPTDIKLFGNKNTDEIVNLYKNKLGHFYSVDVDIYDESDLLHLDPQFTKDKEYAIVYDIPCDINNENLYDNNDFFIDIYKIIEDDNTMVPIEKVCEWLKSKDELCMGELSMILGTYFIENFKRDMLLNK